MVTREMKRDANRAKNWLVQTMRVDPPQYVKDAALRWVKETEARVTRNG